METYRFAVKEALRYAEGGVHGLFVENHWDIHFPKPEDMELETAAAMALMASRVKRDVGLPIGTPDRRALMPNSPLVKI